MKRAAALALLILLPLACAKGPSGSPAYIDDDDDDDDGATTASTSPSPSPTSTAAPACESYPASVFPAQWINGTNCANEVQIQVHQVDANTWILRQSMCTNFEGPFLYLLFGDDKVLLEDTGAGGIQIQAAVQAIINQWLTDNGKASIQLVVVNSHGHGDHVAGNGQFQGQPNTTVVGTTVANVQSFFGIANWPTDTAAYDLGGRVIDVVPIPGHQTAHIALYDHRTGFLLTGDTLYSGRLYVQDFNAYVASLQRLTAFVEEKEVCWITGTHVEMTATAGQDFAFGSTMHPNEHVLQLDRANLVELRDAAAAMQGNPVREVHDHFILDP